MCQTNLVKLLSDYDAWISYKIEYYIDALFQFSCLSRFGRTFMRTKLNMSFCSMMEWHYKIRVLKYFKDLAVLCFRDYV